MARDIPYDQPLSEDDRKYLQDRGAWGAAHIQRIDENFPPEAPVALEDDEVEDTGEDYVPVDYSSWTKAELVGEINRRNSEGRDPALANSGTNATLVAVLEADDAEQADNDA